jgi:hypothetical protein
MTEWFRYKRVLVHSPARAPETSRPKTSAAAAIAYAMATRIGYGDGWGGLQRYQQCCRSRTYWLLFDRRRCGARTAHRSAAHESFAGSRRPSTHSLGVTEASASSGATFGGAERTQLTSWTAFLLPCVPRSPREIRCFHPTEKILWPTGCGAQHTYGGRARESRTLVCRLVPPHKLEHTQGRSANTRNHLRGFRWRSCYA